MSLKTLIDRIVPQIPEGWSRATGTRSIARVIQDGQDLLFDYDDQSMVYIGEDNRGFPPFLDTTSGTYKYAINDTTLGISLTRPLGGNDVSVRCKQVKRIFYEVLSGDYGRFWAGPPFLYQTVNPLTTATDRLYFVPAPLRKYPALEDDDAFIVFTDDPGTTSSKFYVEFIWEPPRLIAETVPLVVPQKYEMALEDFTVGYISKQTNGKQTDRLNKFEIHWQPRFRAEMNYYTQSGPVYTDVRPC